MKIVKKISVLLLITALLSTTSGCLLLGGGAIGAGGYAYHKGRICQTYKASFQDTWAAAHTALADLGMPILLEDPVRGFIESRTGDGKTVQLDITSQPSKIPADGLVTRVCARVAVFGDEEVSHRIFNQIHARLGFPISPTPSLPAP